jgi:hypothetical protein
MISKNRFKRHAANQVMNSEVARDSESVTSITSTASLVAGQERKEEQGLPLPATEIVKAWLAKPNNRRWIMIFDGADDCKSLRVEEFVPDTKHGHIILTSRHCDFSKSSKGIELGPMGEDEATRLLFYSCPTWKGPDGKVHGHQFLSTMLIVPQMKAYLCKNWSSNLSVCHYQ